MDRVAARIQSHATNTKPQQEHANIDTSQKDLQRSLSVLTLVDEEPEDAGNAVCEPGSKQRRDEG